MESSTNKNIDVSKVSSSSSVKKTFKKRTGTTDFGKEYENELMAHIVLQQIFNNDSEDFLVWSNDENFGAFDDVILHSDIKCAIQLKHVIEENRTLTLDSFKADKGDFSIKKLYHSFKDKEVFLSDYDLIIFTNLNFTLGESKKLLLFDEEEFCVEIVEVEVNPIINTKKENQKCLKFKIAQETLSNKLKSYEKFFEKLFIYGNQMDVTTLEENIYKQMEETFSCKNDVAKKYVEFFTNWNLVEDEKDKLNKTMMKRLLALSLVSANLRPISFGNVSENRRILQSAMSKFHVTIFEQECSQDIWIESKSNVDPKAANITNKNYQITKFNLQDINNLSDENCTKLLWLMDKCPLVVEESPAVYEAIKLCIDRRFVVLTNNKSLNLEEQLVFLKLSDLKIHPEIYEDLLSNFKCLLSEKEINLKDIENEITTNELLLMADKPYKIKQEIEELPETYVPRRLTRNIIDFKFLDNIDKETVVFVNYIKSTEKLGNNAVDIEKYFNKSRIIFPNNNQDSHLSFEEFCNKKFYKSNHQLQMFEGRLEWLQSEGGISILRQYSVKNCTIKEEKLADTNVKNNIHIVVGDSGLGKSCFLKNLKNNLSSKTVVILFSPEEMIKISNFIKTGEDKLDDFILDLKYKNWKKFDRCIFKRLLDQNQVVFLWDALDEIVNDNNRNTILDVVRKFAEKGRVQWLTCRRHLKDDLEKRFDVLSKTLVEFNTTEQKNYIQERLKSVCLEEDERQEVTSRILSNVSILKHRDILSIPLQIFMLTEICRQDKNKITELGGGAFSLANLYEYFVEEKLNFCYKKDSLDDSVLTKYEKEKKLCVQEFEKAALKAILEDDIFNKLDVDLEEDWRGFGDKFGFFTEVKENNSKSTIKFSHISYAEYFVACYFARRKKGMIKNFIFEEKYENVRFFLDSILAKNCPAHIATLNNNVEELKKCEQEGELRDAWGRNPLQLVCSWGGKWELQHFEKEEDKFLFGHYNDNIKETPHKYLQILDILISKYDIDEIDKIMQMSAVKYAEKCSSLFALAVMAEKCQTVYSNLTEEIKCNILFYSVQLNLKRFVSTFKSYVNRILSAFGRNTLLHLACENGNEEMIKELIDNGSDINALNGNDRRPFMLACQSGNKDVVEKFIKAGVDMNAENKTGKTPFMFACESENEEIAEMLIKAGVDINSIAKNDKTPFMFACQLGKKNILEMLIKAGVDVNATDEYNRTPFMIACQRGNEDIVEMLIKAGGDINAVYKDDDTPFIVACESGEKDIVKVLLKAGVDINAADEDGLTPFMFVCQWGRKEIIEMLIESVTDVNAPNKDGKTPLIFACEFGNEDAVEMLIKAGVDLNAADKDGKTALIFAFISENEDIVEMLMEAGVDINAANKDGLTPFMFACEGQHENLVKMLIKAGVNMNAADKNGKTPFMFACQWRNKDTVEMLIKAGLDLHAVDKDGKTAFMFACRWGNQETVKTLIKAGVDINAADKNGNTSLMLACERRDEDIVETLIKAGVDLNATDKNGNTAFIVACKSGDKDIVNMLIKSGTDVNAANKDGKTPFMAACESQNKNVVKTLIKEGVDINASDKNGWTPLMFVCCDGQKSYLTSINGHHNIVEILVKTGATVDSRNAEGTTALIFACSFGLIATVELLIKFGANVNVVDNNGLSPIGAAFFNNHKKIVNLLAANGADFGPIKNVYSTPLYYWCENGNVNHVRSFIEMKTYLETVVYNGWRAIHIACFLGHTEIVHLLLRSGANVHSLTSSGDSPIQLARENGHTAVEKIIKIYQ